MHPFLKTGCRFRLPDYKSGPLIMYAVNNPYLLLESFQVTSFFCHEILQNAVCSRFWDPIKLILLNCRRIDHYGIDHYGIDHYGIDHYGITLLYFRICIHL